MRISDWSSDVCSSDLAVTRDGCCALPTQRERRRRRLRVKLGAPPLLAASMADHPRIAFLASRAEPAQQALAALRSEEHTSELQSLMRISYAVFCLKKKTNYYTHT